MLRQDAPMKMVVMVSGGGTNLQAIIDSIKNGQITNAEIAGVISNNKNAYALKRAEENGIPGRCVSPKDYASRKEFNEKLLETVEAFSPDLVVLAGFLVVIPPAMIERYRNRMINIPLLLRQRLLWSESPRSGPCPGSKGSGSNGTFCR